MTASDAEKGIKIIVDLAILDAMTDAELRREWNEAVRSRDHARIAAADVEFLKRWPLKPDTGEKSAEQIADAVISFLVKRGALDADNEYQAADVINALNDLVEG